MGSNGSQPFDRVDRRSVIRAGAVVTGAALAGCMGDGNGNGDDADDNDDDGPIDDSNGNDDAGGNDEVTEPHDLERQPPSLRGKNTAWSLGPDGPGMDFEPLIDIDGDYTPEGLAYKDGHIYVGERDSPCTIREYTVDGEKTDREYEFEDLRVDHTNTMDWYDGNLWISDSSTSTTYILDWGDEPELVDTFAQEDPYSGTWRAIIPTSDGTPKLVATQFRGPRAWVFDLESTLEDGTWRGNVDKTIRNGFWTNIQTFEWHKGAMYTTTHKWIAKNWVPFADQWNDEFPITSYNIEWAYDIEVGTDLLEQLTYNEDDNEFYLCDRGGLGMIYRGIETYNANRNDPWSGWGTVSGGYNAERVMTVNQPGARTLEFTWDDSGRGEEKVGWLDVWYRDSGDVDEKNVGAGFISGQNDFYGLGVWTDVNTENYAVHNGEEWVDTGIERVDDRTWIKLGFSIHNDRVSTHISKTHGQTWEEAAVFEGDSMGTHRPHIRNEGGEARIGNWTVDLQNIR